MSETDFSDMSTSSQIPTPPTPLLSHTCQVQINLSAYLKRCEFTLYCSKRYDKMAFVCIQILSEKYGETQNSRSTGQEPEPGSPQMQTKPLNGELRIIVLCQRRRDRSYTVRVCSVLCIHVHQPLNNAIL